MSERKEVIERSMYLASTGSPGVLATIVRTSGSTYRRAGTRMLIEAEGKLTGFISAGCLESDLSEHAKRVLVTSQAARVSYDTTAEDDIIWGLGLGCNGLVEILLEPVSSPSARAKLEILSRALQTTSKGYLVTVVESTHPAAGTGSYLFAENEGNILSDLKDPQLRLQLEREIHRQSENIHPWYTTVGFEGYHLALMVEFLSPPMALTIFGSGPDIAPIVELAQSLGWNTTVIDKHPEAELRKRFPKAHSVRTLSVPVSIESFAIDEQSVVLIMTHNYLVDIELLRVLLPSSVRYIGLLGPKRRGEQILDTLRTEGMEITGEQLLRLHSPIGLDIGSETSAEIALSIVSEIQTVRSHRSGGFLRDRNSTIHDKSQEAS